MTKQTRRRLLQTAAALPLAAMPAAAAGGKVLKNMGSAGPGLGARIRAPQAAGKEWDIVAYCHEMGLGAAHTNMPRDLTPAGVKKLRDQVNQWDMRLTIGLRSPRSESDLPQYEAAVKAASEMD